MAGKMIVVFVAAVCFVGCGQNRGKDFYESLYEESKDHVERTANRMKIKRTLEESGYTNVIFNIDCGMNYVTADLVERIEFANE